MYKGTEILKDSFGRRINYLRISVTDRCDLRCLYCMDEQVQFAPRKALLTLEELATVAKAFAELGVEKIRITGGEPLVRKNVISLFKQVGRLPGLKELVTTTNGSQLSKLAVPLVQAGVSRVNISLDTLSCDRFRQMTRTGNLKQVLAGIDVALLAGFSRIKINTVILRHINDDEIINLTLFAAKRGMDISFIEEMPLGVIQHRDRQASYMPSDEILQRLKKEFNLLPSTDTTGGPSRYYNLVDDNIRVGFISPHSHNFCDACNRVRLTCEGRLLLCLGQEHSVDLRSVVRSCPGDLELLKQVIQDSMKIKPKGHDFDLTTHPMIFRHMNVTGG